MKVGLIRGGVKWRWGEVGEVEVGWGEVEVG